MTESGTAPSTRTDARRLVAVALGLVGAIGLIAGAFAPWIDRASAARIPAIDLVTGISDAEARSEISMATLLVGTGVISVVGAALSARFVLLVGGLLALTVETLWVVMESVHRAPGDFIAAQLGAGAWLAFVGMLLVDASALMMPARAERWLWLRR